MKDKIMKKFFISGIIGIGIGSFLLGYNLGSIK